MDEKEEKEKKKLSEGGKERERKVNWVKEK